MKNNQLLREKKDIINWLNQYQIKDYELIKDTGYRYVVNVGGSVDISKKKLISIAVKFNIIEFDFYCNSNQLISLECCPKEVGGDFSCSHNQLIILELKNLPEIIKGIIYLDNNPLLGPFQDIKDFNELRHILTVQEEEKLFQELIKNTTINSKVLKL